MTAETLAIRTRWLSGYLAGLRDRTEQRRKSWWKIQGGNRSAARSRAKDKTRPKPQEWM